MHYGMLTVMAQRLLEADEQSGYYVEPSFRISPKLGVFARYNVWDKAAGDSNDSEYKQNRFGSELLAT